ncbi:MAG TPA: PIN domain-containing protein [Solirubrobacterales bacterium]|nr:PIN domain-containing protein [Solirubrobacterales bacterium]
MAVVLDSDAVVAFLDRADALHDAADEAIRELLGKDRLFALAVTYAEVLTGARLGRHDEKRVRGFFADLISEILPVDAKVADKVADLRAGRKSLRMPDALILATADLHPEVDLVVTGDQRAAKITGSSFKVKLLQP